MISGRRLDGVLAFVLGAGALTAYAARTARDLGWVDSVELTLAAASLGIPHPTGYPLYLLCARIAFVAGGIAGVNLLSAGFGAAAVSVTYLAVRALGTGRWGAVVAGSAFAIHPELIRQATVAEVYTLHLVLVGLAVLFSARAGRVASAGRDGLLLAYVVGLGVAHHLTILFVLPAVVALGYPAWARRPRSPGEWALLAGIAGLPLTLYAGLAIRSGFDPTLDLGDPETPGRLFAHVTGRQFGYRMLSGEPGYFVTELAAWARRIEQEWAVLLLALAALGTAALLVRQDRRRTLAGLGLLAVVTGGHAAAYRIPDKEPYFLPAYLACALLAGEGAEAVLGWIRARWAGRAHRRSGATGGVPAARTAVVTSAAVALLLLGVVVPAVTRPAVDRHADRSLRDLALEVLRRAPAGSLILADDTSLAFALDYVAQEPAGPRGRTTVATYFLPLEWYARAQAAIDPDLPARAGQMAEARQGLHGRALGDRLASDARQLAAQLARSNHAQGQPVRFTFHDFGREYPAFEGLPLADLGLAYALRTAGDSARAPAPTLDPEFACLATYTSGRALTREERSLSKRLAAAANRAGIARVEARDLGGAEAEFDRALALDSLFAQAWLNRGLLRADYLRQPAAALADWRRYLALAEAGREQAAVQARVSALAADSARAHP